MKPASGIVGDKEKTATEQYVSQLKVEAMAQGETSVPKTIPFPTPAKSPLTHQHYTHNIQQLNMAEKVLIIEIPN